MQKGATVTGISEERWKHFCPKMFKERELNILSVNSRIKIKRILLNPFAEQHENALALFKKYYDNLYSLTAI